ncbi:MAG TPA: helix-turn-helix transcriptional regulator [Candidatus Kapabacteria bacterium]|nr:helix-turn-helix transcriptional regulator [Candidatus Kapabacteria bacterium]
MARNRPIPSPEFLPFGERLRMFTKQGYRTARSLSEQTGIDTSALSLYFSGERWPGARHLKSFFDAGLSLDWLFANEQDLHRFTMFRSGSTAPHRPASAGQISDAELMAELTRRMARAQ